MVDIFCHGYSDPWMVLICIVCVMSMPGGGPGCICQEVTHAEVQRDATERLRECSRDVLEG